VTTLLDRQFLINNVIDRIEWLEHRLRELESGIVVQMVPDEGGGDMPVNLNEGPDIDVVGMRIGRGGDSILVFFANGDPVAEFTTLDAAVAAATAAGDTIVLPSRTIAVSAGATLAAGVALVGMSDKSVLSFSGFSGTAITLAADAICYGFTLTYASSDTTAVGIDAQFAGALVRGVVVNVSGGSVSNVGIMLGVSAGTVPIVLECRVTATGTAASALMADTSMAGVALYNKLSGATYDLNVVGTLSVYGNQYTHASVGGTPTMLAGDRAAYGVEDWHASDIEGDVLTRHTPLPASQGLIIRSSATEWETHAAATAGFLLQGDGTDVESAAFDWATIAAASGADVVHDHTSNAEGGTLASSGGKGIVQVIGAGWTFYSTTGTNEASQGTTVNGASTPAEAIAQPLRFDATAIEYHDFTCALLNYNGGGLTFTLPWLYDYLIGDPEVCRWGVAIRRLNAGEDFSASHTYDFNDVDSAAQDAAYKVAGPTVTFTDGADMDNWASGELAIVRVRRNATHENDTLEGDAVLIGFFGVET